MPTPEQILEQARVRHLGGDPTGALPLYLKGLSQAPKSAPARYLCGLALNQLRRPAAAAEQLRQAVALAPTEVVFVSELSRTERILGEFDRAIACWVSAIDIAPDRLDLRLALSETFVEVHRVDEAITTLQAASSRWPEPKVWLALARLLERTGRLTEAADLASRIIDQRPEHAEALLVLARVARGRGDAPHEERLLRQSIAASPQSVAAGLALLDLGALEESAGRAAEAMGCYQRGKDLLRSQLPPAEQDPRPLLDLISSCRDQPLAREAGRGLPESPIFFVGFPRSGTTLLEQLLGAHSSLATTDELPLIQGVRETLHESFAGRVDYPLWLNHLSLRQVQRAAESYWRRARWLLGTKLSGRRLVDKQPLNLIHLPLITRLFPAAPIIVMLRDPRDTCLSCFAQPMKHIPAFYSLRDTAELFAAFDDLWLRYRDTLKSGFIEVCYEDLVADTPGQARRLFEFLGLPWDDRVLDRTPAGFISTPSYRDVSRPVYRSAVARWRKFANAFRGLEPVLAPAVRAHGYGP